eukprot:8761371-Pyramimonas_sp.AAC.1
MKHARRVAGYPPRPHYPMAVDVGPRPRARQVVKLKAPRPYAPKPDSPPLLEGDDDPPSNA